MNYAKIRDTLLSILGMTALLVYVIACRPSVSPDGTRVVFPIIDQEAHTASVAVYDLKRNAVEKILDIPGAKDEFMAYSAQWLPDGRQVLINGVSSIMILPAGSPNPTRFIPLEHALEPFSLMTPPPVVGSYQFFSGRTSGNSGKGNTSEDEKNSFLRVNLDTGETLSVPHRGECYLSGAGTLVYYVAETDEGEDRSYEIGRLDTDKLVQIPMLHLKEKESGEITPFLAWSKDGSRLALTGKLAEAPRLLLFRNSAFEKTIAVGSAESGITLGNAEWAPNGDILYVSYARKSGSAGDCRYGVLEVPVSGGGIREVPLFGGKGTDDELSYFQIVLSPDARQILATSVCMKDEAIKSEDRALYLIDLTNPGRIVTRFPVPFPSALKSAPSKK
jgi:hypothetical protein